MGSLIELLLSEVMHDSHRYVPGIDHARPTLAPGRRALRRTRERARDAVERAAGSLGLSRRHYDPDRAAGQLQRVLELADGLEATYAALADQRSRRALLDVLKLRVLGPHHAALRVTPEAFRRTQADADRRLRIREATFEVSDPWFSPLSLYRVPVGDEEVQLHAHSVDVASVFLLGQYGYPGAGVTPGDVVIDAGGCWGDTALAFAARAGSDGKVYTFEFDPESLEILRANLALNPRLAARIDVVEAALWERSGERLAYAQAGRMTKVLGPSANGAGHAETLALDDFVGRARLERLDFLKIDVEGAERSVLRGAEQTLCRHAPRLAIAIYHHDDDLVQIPAMLRSLGIGYRFYLDSFSPVEEETVLFATAARNST